MKALVVYESMFGNQTSRPPKRSLQASASRLTSRQQKSVRRHLDLGSDVDLIVAGGPTHAFSMRRTTTRSDAVSKGATEGESEFGLRGWLAGLPSGHNAEKIATFDTKIDTMRHLPGSAAKGAAKDAHRHGYDSVARAESFMWTMLKVRCWSENSTAPGNGGAKLARSLADQRS